MLAFSMIGKVSRRTTRGLGKFRFAVSVLLLGPALSGCILGTERPDLNLDMPAAYREGGRTAPDAHLPAVDWWRDFKSSELTSLMDAAQLYNLDPLFPGPPMPNKAAAHPAAAWAVAALLEPA